MGNPVMVETVLQTKGYSRIIKHRIRYLTVNITFERQCIHKTTVNRHFQRLTRIVRENNRLSLVFYIKVP